MEVPGWAPAKGYANGMVASGRVLAIAGQIGWDAEQRFEHADFVGQFGQALENVCAVVRAAGGQPEDIIKMTLYVTDLDLYRSSLRALGPVWRAHLGRHYPAMALLGVTGLVEREALLEIECLAVLPEAP